MAYGDQLNSFEDYAQRTWKDLLARMIYSEAGNQTEEGKRGCAFVAQNRVDKDSDEFGHTMKEVLLKESQFSGMTTKNALKPDTDSDAWRVSLDIAMNLSSKENPVGACLWFNTNALYDELTREVNGIVYYHFKNSETEREVIERKTIGNHTFFRLSGY